MRDNGTALVPLPWSPVTLTNPSIVLQKPGSDYLYLGEGNGRLYHIDAVTGALDFLVLEAGFPLGAPSLDNANDLVLVGSATGTIYAVQVPF